MKIKMIQIDDDDDRLTIGNCVTRETVHYRNTDIIVNVVNKSYSE